MEAKVAETIPVTVLATIIMGVLAAMMIASRKMRRQKARATSTTEWPASPTKLPIIGNLHQVAKGGSCLHLTLAKLAKVHGGVMTIWMGSRQPVIVASSRDAIWEVLVTKSSDYASRHFPMVPRRIQDGIHTIAISDYGTYWNSLRKGLTGGAFSPINFSAQSQAREGFVMDMIRDMMQEASMNGGIVKPYPHLRRAIIRTLARFVFGSDPKDEKFVEDLDQLVEDGINISSFKTRATIIFDAVFADLIPVSVSDEFARRTENVVRSYLSSPPPPNCFLHFLQSNNMAQKDMMLTILELFALAIDSTTSTTTWALGFLIRDRKIQDKLYQEINSREKSGQGDDTVRVEELNKLPYLHAVLKEGMRMKPIAPLAVAHKASKDTTLAGYKVAAGTPVWVNLYNVHYDPTLWTEPDRFMPERFLEGKDYQQSFMPFGAGMRVCVGGEVGKVQAALALANMVRAFDWVPAADGQPPDLAEYLIPVSNVLVMKTPLAPRIIPRGQLDA